MDTLCYIKNNSTNRNNFITNRVTKTRENIPSSHWRFCPYKINPADLPSRGLSILNSGSWFENWINGPDFIYQELLYWPTDPSKILVGSRSNDTSFLSLVIKSSPKDLMKLSIDNSEVKEVLETSSLNLRNIISIERFSSLHKLLKVTACVLKFVKNLKHLVNKANIHINFLRTEDIRNAETI